MNELLRAAVDDAGPDCSAADLADCIQNRAKMCLSVLDAEHGLEMPEDFANELDAHLFNLSLQCAAQLLVGIANPVVAFAIPIDAPTPDGVLPCTMGECAHALAVVLGVSVLCRVYGDGPDALWLNPPEHEEEPAEA